MSVINFNQAKAEKEAQISGEDLGFDGLLEAFTEATQIAILNSKEETFRAILAEVGISHEIMLEDDGAEKIKKHFDDLGLVLVNEGDSPDFDFDDDKEELYFTGGWALFRKEDENKEDAEPVHLKTWKITHQFAGGDKE